MLRASRGQFHEGTVFSPPQRDEAASKRHLPQLENTAAEFAKRRIFPTNVRPGHILLDMTQTSPDSDDNNIYGGQEDGSVVWGLGELSL